MSDVKNPQKTPGQGIKDAFNGQSKNSKKKKKSTPTDTKPTTETGTSVKSEQVIEWNPATVIVYGTKLSDLHLNAKVPTRDVKLTYSLKGKAVNKGASLGLGKQEIRVDAPATSKFNAASKTVEFEVQPKIVWNDPGRITYGQALGPGQLNAKVEPSGPSLVYSPLSGVVLEAGSGQPLTVRATVEGTDIAVTKVVHITVDKAPPKITWDEPDPVPPGTSLSATQLNATSNSTATLVYSPARDEELTEPKTYWLTVSQEATKNHLSAIHKVRLLVANDTVIDGLNDAMDGSNWDTDALNTASQRVLNDWNTNKGNMRTQGEQLMRDLSSKTGPEIIAHMNGLVKKDSDKLKKSKGEDPTQMWKFPNGLQVRYKPNGDKRNRGVPMFCIEGRTGSEFSKEQSEIAFKLSATGVPTAKGPGSVDASNVDVSDRDDYRDGACKATHLFCEPKSDPVIEWNPPTQMEVTSEYSIAQLNAVLKFGDNKLTYSPDFKSKPTNVETGAELKVTAKATDRFNPATKTVKINVVKTKATIVWDPPPDDIVYGQTLGNKQLNATANKGAELKFKPGLSTRLKVGDNQPLRAFVEENRYYEAVEKTVTINVKKAKPNIDWGDQEIEYGTELTDKQLCASQSGDGELTYDPPLGELLEVGDDQPLTVTSAETSNYQSTTKQVKINVRPADPKLSVTIKRKTIPYGASVEQLEPEHKRKGEGEVTYSPGLKEKLPVKRYKLKASVAATATHRAGEISPIDFSVVQADHKIIFPDKPIEIVYPTPLTAELLQVTCETGASLIYEPKLETVLDAGNNQFVKVTAKGDTNYKGRTINVPINVLKAKHQIEWTPKAIDFGIGLGPDQLNATCSTAQSLIYLHDLGHVFPTAGPHKLQVTAADTGNYEETTLEVDLNINPATPTIEWLPEPLTYGTPLSSKQLNARSNSDGEPTYVPALSELLGAGPGKNLKVTFAATKNYKVATQEVRIDVARAQPVIEWWEDEEDDGPIIQYGTALSEKQLNASVAGILSGSETVPFPGDIPGELQYTPKLGEILNAGLDQPLRVTLAASENFEAASKEISIDVLHIQPIIAWENPGNMQEGDALTTDQLNATCENGGPLVYDPPLGHKMSVGDGQILRVSIAGTTNSLLATKTVVVNVTPRS